MKHWFFLSLLLVCKLTFGQSKIGIVNSQSLLERLPSRDSVMQNIEEKQSVYMRVLEGMDSILNVMIADIPKHHSCFDTNIDKLYTDSIAKYQMKILKYEQEADTELARLMKACDDNGMLIIRHSIEKVSLNLGLSVVLDESQVMYFADELNITETVFTEMVKIDQLPR